MQIVQDYRYLHTIPELDSSLPKTLSFIQKRLNPLKCRVFSPTKGSLCAYFHFGKSKTIALRADTDALPVTEATSLPWESRHKGMMHACGHDGHTAILLELARRINCEKDLPNNVLLIFQPAEETTGGAEKICNTGILKNFHVQSIFALHLWPGLEAGQIYSKPEYLMSRCCAINVCFTGPGGHISNPGADALNACCRFYCKTMELQDRDPHLLKFGKLFAGDAGNVLCSKAELTGSLRTYRKSVEQRLQAVLTYLCKQTAKQSGCDGNILFHQGYPAVYNDPELFIKVQKICPVRTLDRAYWTGEDFSYYQQMIPGVYFLLGIGDAPQLHSSNFHFNENALSVGADIFYKLLKV